MPAAPRAMLTTPLLRRRAPEAAAINRKDRAMIKPTKLDRTMKQGHRSGGFGIEILFPGRTLEEGDSGIGAIGRIDHAHVTPGTVIRMHPHKDDEILTYLRRGTVMHSDTVGHQEPISDRKS